MTSNTNFDQIRYWDTTGEGFVYPEMNPSDEMQYKSLVGRPSTGICISGGGSVSASLAAGYFKAIEDLTLMNNVCYISGVSGGTWGSAPYCFLPDDTDIFFGDYLMPEDITVASMNTADDHTMPAAVENADIVKRGLFYLGKDLLKQVPPHYAYGQAVGSMFLSPFTINSPAEEIENASYFTTDGTAAQNIVSRNSSLQQSEFMTMKEDRPFLIMNATMFVPNDGGFDIYPFEFTPLYCGIKAVQNPGNNNQPIGGAFVETFGFNTTVSQVTSSNLSAAAQGQYPFELCQPVGASGSALEEIVDKNNKLADCFPQFNYWNPLQGGTPDTQLYDFGDGGCIEDTGVSALLARGVKNIAMFLTEPILFPAMFDMSPKADGWGERAFGYNQIACLFGEQLIDTKTSQDIDKLTWLTPTTKSPLNYRQVFDNSAGQFNTLLGSFYTAKGKGEAQVIPVTLDVIPNALFGIPGNYPANIVWAVVDTCTQWSDQLIDDVKSAMEWDNFSDFPEIKVFGQDLLTVIALTAPQSNMLSNLGYWMVMANQDLYNTLFQPATATTH